MDKKIYNPEPDGGSGASDLCFKGHMKGFGLEVDSGTCSENNWISSLPNGSACNIYPDIRNYLKLSHGPISASGLNRNIKRVQGFRPATRTAGKGRGF